MWPCPAASVNQCSSDAAVALPEVVKQVEANLHSKPAQMVVDGGYTGHANVVSMAEGPVGLIGPVPDTAARQAAARKASGIGEEFAAERFRPAEGGAGLLCPQGELLKPVRRNQKRGNLFEI